jgi:hypothetical protein
MTAQVNQEFVLAKCSYFLDVHLWPVRATLDPEHWLGNFEDDEHDHAVHLLNSFLYYSDGLIDHLLLGAFQGISKFLRPPDSSFLHAQSVWRAFVDTVLVTHVSGEDPSTTDSGFIFARKARQVLEIREEHILPQRAIIDQLLTAGPWPVLFVDDFVGSGNQFIETWTRRFPVSSTRTVSFSELARARGQTFYYCPLVCTEYGRDQIRARCPSVILHPAHFLPSTYSAISPDSLLWPPALQASASALLRKASLRAGLPDTNGAHVNDWQGFHCLGLAVAFAHSVPDATMPIFYWERNGWRPLIRRR